MLEQIKIYMQQISPIPLLTREQEKEYSEAYIARKDPEARSRLIYHNLRLVVKIAHDFKGRGLPLLDLIGEGNIGLITGAERFDYRKGAKFSSYASWWIKQSMRRAIYNQKQDIRMSVNFQEKARKVKEAYKNLEQLYRRPPTPKEIAEETELTER